MGFLVMQAGDRYAATGDFADCAYWKYRSR